MPNVGAFSLCIVVLVILGALDDKYDVDFRIRFTLQAVISVSMMYWGQVELNSLGDLFGFGNIELGYFGYLITVLAVIAAINAFNMVDGIDGLLGGLSVVTFASLGFIMYINGIYNIAYLCLVLVIMILPYILVNLGFLGRKRKIFMGDAGSMLIGFTVVWLLLLSTQYERNTGLRPVTALWLIAIPLMDMVCITIRRLRKGVSPFKPDREHLHHICQRLGLSSSSTLIFICTIAVSLSVLGIAFEYFSVSEYIVFYTYIIIFFFYYFLINHASSKVN